VAKPGTSDPQSGRFLPLFNPRQQKWSRHFAWDADFLFIQGRTAVGRAAVAALHLNSPALLNLRRALRAVGEQPP
ncbi:MAG TPA: HNH endonuclease, partial [Planctomycetales bacterium]|nr:HNH endonuclease [Planctomycetales bacterium]